MSGRWRTLAVRPLKAAMPKVARHHHFVPQSYLGAFTDDGTRDGRLFVSDLVSRSTFWTKPRNVAAVRDFNRVDLVGREPDTLETAFAEFEGRTAPVLRKIRESGTIPPDDDMSYVINLMALLTVRNPKSRRAMNAARRHEIRIIGSMLASDRRLFESQVAKAREEGFIRPDLNVPFEELRRFLRGERYSVTVSTGESLLLEMSVFDSALQMFGTRYWSLVMAPPAGPEFVTSDHPVGVVFKDSNVRGPIGYGLPGTEVTFPVGARHVLLGVFEDPLARQIDATAGQVAAVNSRTVRHADRQVYSRTESVTILRNDGIGNLDLARSNTQMEPTRR